MPHPPRTSVLLGLLALAVVALAAVVGVRLGDGPDRPVVDRTSVAVRAPAVVAPTLLPVTRTERATARAKRQAAGGTPSQTKPNIVYVLTDDLTADLLPYMPSVQQLAAEGTSFTNFFVANSLCCPSRASTFTGQYPHSTGVRTNTYPDGGWYKFQERGLERSTYATDLQKAGYRTALMGKYLNEYEVASGVPPGWDEWAVTNKGYHNVNYTLNVNGRRVRFGGAPKDYLTDVIGRRAKTFIRDAKKDKQPFFLELSTFAPHGPATPARRDRGKLAGIQAPRTPAFDQVVSDGPSWLRGRAPLTPEQITQLDARFEDRAESVLAVDKMITDVRARLDELGLSKDTYIVFNSDNGFHLGQRRLMPGKMTAYDDDIKVPMIVAGPGVPAGAAVPQIAQNVDLRPTFDTWAGAKVKPVVEGASLAGLAAGEQPAAWRQTALVEHVGPDLDPSDPDYQAAPGGNPTTYDAIRFDGGLYVESANGEREYYDLQADPDALHNVYAQVSEARRADLAARVARLRTCRGASCFYPG